MRHARYGKRAQIHTTTNTWACEIIKSLPFCDDTGAQELAFALGEHGYSALQSSPGSSGTSRSGPSLRGLLSFRETFAVVSRPSGAGPISETASGASIPRTSSHASKCSGLQDRRHPVVDAPHRLVRRHRDDRHAVDLTAIRAHPVLENRCKRPSACCRAGRIKCGCFAPGFPVHS